MADAHRLMSRVIGVTDMKLQSFSKKWGKTPKTVVDTRVKQVIVPGRLVEIKQAFRTSSVPGLPVTSRKGS